MTRCNARVVAAVLLAIVGATAGRYAVLTPRTGFASPSTDRKSPGGAITGTVRHAERGVAAAVELRLADVSAASPTEAELLAGLADVAEIREAPIVARASAGSDGRFRFDAVATGRYVVRAETADGLKGSVAVFVEHAGTTLEADIEVFAGAFELKGSVRHADDTPFQGNVDVLLVPPGSPAWNERRPRAGTDVVRTMTDEGGRFEVSGLVRGEYALAVADGPLRAQLAVSVPLDSDVAISLPGPTPPTGSVVVARATGEPITGATVLWRFGTIAAWRIKTGTDGRFPRIDPERGEVAVTAAGYATWSPWGAPSEFGRRGTERIELERAASIRGRATSASDGRPVAGVEVSAYTVGGVGSGTPWARTTTDGDGRYEVTGLPPGEIAIRACGDGGIARGMAGLDVEVGIQRLGALDFDPFAVSVAAGSAAVLDLVIESAATLVVHVVDATGAPVVGAVVRAEGPHGNNGMSSDSPPPPDWDVFEIATNTKGDATLARLAPDRRYRLAARLGSRLVRGVVTSPAVGASRATELRLPTGVSFDLVTVDAANDKVAPAVVVSAAASNGVDGEDVIWSGRTSEAGRVRVGPFAPNTLVRLAGVGAWHEVSRTWISVDEIARGPQPLTLRVRRGPTTIERWERLVSGAPESDPKPAPGKPLLVRVVDADGHPVPSAGACWRSETTDTTTGLVEVRDGRAAIPRPVGASRTWLEIGAARAADGHVLPLGSAKAGPFAADLTETEVWLPPERALVGRLSDPAGRGVRGLRVRAMRMDAVWRMSELQRIDDEAVARTDSDGRFRIGGLPDEPMRLAITVPSAYVDVWPIVTRPGDAPVEIRLRPATTATLTLVHADGRPATNAWVYAMAESDDRDDGAPYYVWTSRAPSASTDGSGIARLRGLDPEARHLLTAGDRDTDSKERARIEGWAPKDTRIVLAGPRAIRGIVRDPKGQPVAQARVTTVEGRSDGHGVETAADGTFSLEADPAQTPRIHAALHEGGWGPQSAPVTVTSRDEPVVLVIETGVDLAVRVDGEGAANRSVGLRSTPGMDWPSGRWIWTTTDADGRARVRGLPPDRGYVLWIRPSSETDDTYAYAEGASASAAGPESRVNLAKGGSIKGRLKGLATWSHAYVDATRDGMRVDGKVEADGTFEIRGLPDLEWTVTGHVRADGAPLRGEAQARPGAEVVVEVKPSGR